MDRQAKRRDRSKMTFNVTSPPSLPLCENFICPCQTWRAPRPWRYWPASIAGGAVNGYHDQPIKIRTVRRTKTCNVFVI